jgi:hypothetical protein
VKARWVMSIGGGRLLRMSGLVLLAAACAALWIPGRATAATPAVSITPVSGAGPSGQYTDGEVVAVSVKGNSTFVPGSKVNILECADPQGSAANLPKSIATCDGDTIQGDTVLVGTDGSVSESNYTIYQLPSATLGERPDGQPVCDDTNQCVLYVGENQNDFTQPKLFSAAFVVTGAAIAPAPATAGTTVPSGGDSSTTSTSQPLASATTQSTLAVTGVSGALQVLALIGAALLVLGCVGRRWMKAGA